MNPFLLPGECDEWWLRTLRSDCPALPLHYRDLIQKSYLRNGTKLLPEAAAGIHVPLRRLGRHEDQHLTVSLSRAGSGATMHDFCIL